jgi:hypothetical protein
MKSVGLPHQIRDMGPRMTELSDTVYVPLKETVKSRRDQPQYSTPPFIPLSAAGSRTTEKIAVTYMKYNSQ